jgi:mannose-6-phosphate isomerase-like protein (cupin superfamily)
LTKVKEELMTSQAIHAQTPIILQPQDGHFIDELNVRVLASESTTGGAMMACTCINPGPGGPALHTHHAHDEYYLVLRGHYRFQIGDRQIDGGPGTFVSAPRDTIHTFASIGPEEGEVFTIALPGGLERFLERMAKLPVRGSVRDGLPELFSDFASEINGPPLV